MAQKCIHIALMLMAFWYKYTKYTEICWILNLASEVGSYSPGQSLVDF